MITEPPVDVGAVKAIIAVPLPGVAAPLISGAPGTVIGITETLSDTVLSPAAFTAFIWTVYVVPFIRLGIVMGLTVVAAAPVDPIDPTGAAAKYGCKLGSDAFNPHFQAK